jgi:hypothetical protein
MLAKADPSFKEHCLHRPSQPTQLLRPRNTLAGSAIGVVLMLSRTPAGPHSLLPQYDKKARRERCKQRERFAIIDIDDPSGMPVGADDMAAIKAMLAAPPIGARSDDAPHMWDAPTHRSIAIIAAVRDDVAGKMFARRQSIMQASRQRGGIRPPSRSRTAPACIRSAR